MFDSSGDMVELLPVNTTYSYRYTETGLSTSFEPQTRSSSESADDITDVYLIPRGDSSPSTLIFDDKLQNFNVTTTTTSMQHMDNTDKLVVVGVTCGVLGVVLGVVISVAFWSYKKRKNKKNELRTTMEKNPKEKTFEPLDLSLTLPNYEPSLHSARRQHSSLGFHHEDSATRGEQRRYKSKDKHHSFKLPSASASSPVIHSGVSSTYTDNGHLQKPNHKSNHGNQCQKSKSWDKTSSLDNRVLRHNTTSHSYGSNDLEVTITYVI